ncbi:MAG TPA: phage BR0599 family protein [Gemmatimonadales bacterium]
MTLDTREKQIYGGQPTEFYLFTQDATVWRYTSADRELLVGSDFYRPEILKRDQMDFSQEEGAATVEVRLPRENPVAQLGISYTPPTPVELLISRRHRGDSEVISWFNGQVTAWRFEGSEAILTCAPISQTLKRKVPSLVQQSQCNWTLYGTGCTVDRAAFKTTAVVDAITGATITASPEFGAQVDGWFTNGYVEIPTTKERRFIVDHVGNVLTLMSPFSSALEVGMSVDAYAGCDRTEATCAAKFANLVNHLGFARIPHRNPFDGALV